MIKMMTEERQLNSSHRKRKRQQVAFHEIAEIIPIASPMERLDVDEWKHIWYDRATLAGFRNEAWQICKTLREKTKNVNCCTLSARDGKTRGLEGRACAERRRRRIFCVRYIIVAARHERFRSHPDRLGRLARKINRWATDVAMEEASRDNFRAWRETPQSLDAFDTDSSDTHSRQITRRISKE